MDTHSGDIGESFRENLLIKSRNQNIFEKFKLNRNLQTIPFKMMYTMSMLRHRFSNELWRRAALDHLPLLFCENVYLLRPQSFSFQIVSQFIDTFVKFSNCMSQGWGFWLPVLSRGEGILHNDCLKGRVSAPLKSCPGGLSRGGWFWMK